MRSYVDTLLKGMSIYIIRLIILMKMLPFEPIQDEKGIRVKRFNELTDVMLCEWMREYARYELYFNGDNARNVFIARSKKKIMSDAAGWRVSQMGVALKTYYRLRVAEDRR